MLQDCLEQLGATESVCEGQVAPPGIQGVVELLRPLAVVVGLPLDPVDLLEEARPELALLLPDLALHAEAKEVVAGRPP